MTAAINRDDCDNGIGRESKTRLMPVEIGLHVSSPILLHVVSAPSNRSALIGRIAASHPRCEVPCDITSEVRCRQRTWMRITPRHHRVALSEMCSVGGKQKPFDAAICKRPADLLLVAMSRIGHRIYGRVAIESDSELYPARAA